MINYKRIIYDIVVAVLVAATLVASAPAGDKPCRGDAEKYIDQRQNGSENYRLNIDGVVFAVAPADTLLAAASEIDLSDLLELDDFNEIQPKPKPPTSEAANKPEAASKPEASPEADKPGEKPLLPATTATKSALEHVEGAKPQKTKKRGLKLRLANLLLPLLKKSRHH